MLYPDHGTNKSNNCVSRVDGQIFCRRDMECLVATHEKNVFSCTHIKHNEGSVD